MLHIDRYRPEFPPNTGNLIRLCANKGARLHLVEPLAYQLDDARVKPAGLDDHVLAHVRGQSPVMRLWSLPAAWCPSHQSQELA